MPLSQIAGPALEPVSVADAKNHLRVDVDLTTDDSLIALLIGAARRYAEMYTGRSFITQTWRQTLDGFPGPSQIGVPYGQTYSLPGHAIVLDRGNVLSVDAIQYLAMDGTTQTMSPATYVADITGSPARITPVFGQIWPINLPQIASVWVNYTAGYGPAATDVPEGVRQWIMLRLNTLYENREEVAILGRGKVEPLPFIDGLLDPYRVLLA